MVFRCKLRGPQGLKPAFLGPVAARLKTGPSQSHLPNQRKAIAAPLKAIAEIVPKLFYETDSGLIHRYCTGEDGYEDWQACAYISHWRWQKISLERCGSVRYGALEVERARRSGTDAGNRAHGGFAGQVIRAGQLGTAADFS